MLIKLAEVLEVEVSDLLGTKIEISEDKNELDVLANELAKLNELLVVYGDKVSKAKRKIGMAIGVIFLLIFVCAIYEPWTDLWHEFGQNLYHLLND